MLAAHTALAAALAALFPFPVSAAAPSPPDTVLRVTFLDVGQGDAVLVQAPEGQTALIDAGGGDIVPLLRAMDVGQIDLLVATHPHADHIGGMARVIESIPVQFFMDNGEPYTTATYRGLIATLEARPEITYLEAVPRTLSLGSATIEVLPMLPRGTTEPNDRSVGLVLRFESFTALLSGDSEVRQLTHLVGLDTVPALTLLKAPHHGSDNGFTWNFLQAARPRVVVISVGPNNYGHPKQAALDAYAATAREIFRTDHYGHVLVQGYEDGSYVVVHGDRVVVHGDRGNSSWAGGRTRGGRAKGAGALVAGAAAAGSVTSASSSHARFRISVKADAPGNDHENLNGEYVILKNSASEAAEIGGWRLCDFANHCFRFPPGATIEGGGRILIHTGTGQPDGERFYMGRNRAIWNNGGDTATLYDSEGATVLTFSY